MLPETIEKFKRLYRDKKETIEWMEKFGTDVEKTEASIIKKVAQDF